MSILSKEREIRVIDQKLKELASVAQHPNLNLPQLKQIWAMRDDLELQRKELVDDQTFNCSQEDHEKICHECFDAGVDEVKRKSKD